MIKVIIFDFFDVIRTDPYKAWLNLKGLSREGPYHAAAEKLDHGFINLEEFFEEISRLSGEKVTREKLEEGAKLNLEVIQIIEKLKSTYTIALLSNAPSDFLRELLQANHLERLFDHIFISSEIGHIKPHREIFEFALEKLAVKPEEAIFIDDNHHHIEGGEAVGIKSIHFNSAKQLEDELIKIGLL
jgi:HAD superfamily hydrolase (TIGR01509 family)